MPKKLTFSKKQLLTGGVVVAVLAILILVLTRPGPLPDDTQYLGADVDFMYPRALTLEEYAVRAVTVGTTTAEGYLPLVNVVRYQNDPDTALPPDFMTFVRRQATALCGSDNSVENISCTDPVFEPYVSAVQGVAGQVMTLTMTRRNLETGDVRTMEYGPIYVFDISDEPEEDEMRRYSALFVYPALASVLEEEDTTSLLEKIMATLEFNW